jgi:pantoate--beta-alanine ligase
VTVLMCPSSCRVAVRRAAREHLAHRVIGLDAGHRSLMRAAREANGFVVVSLFVNPTQFGPTEDLGAYPRDPEGDAAAARAEGVDLLFTPGVEEMYPEPGLTTVHVDGGLTSTLCGSSRPTHFDGVTTVVTKLFSIVGPCRAYFGRKDAQQLAVIRRMTADLDLPVEVVGCPLVREPDGLAMSSRNAYLTEPERGAATALFDGLERAVAAAVAGARDAAVLRRIVLDALEAQPLLEVDYVEVVDAATLAPVEQLGAAGSRDGGSRDGGGRVLVALAVRVGRARLIDNATIAVEGASVVADLGTVAGPGPRPGADARPGDS